MDSGVGINFSEGMDKDAMDALTSYSDGVPCLMGKKTIAEYVEDDEVLEILREIGVDFAQGFGIGRKIPITELLA